MSRLALAFVVLIFSGCVRTRYVEVPVPVEVKVPVPVSPDYPAPPARPALPPAPMPGSDPGLIVLALVERGVILAGYVRELELWITAVRTAD